MDWFLRIVRIAGASFPVAASLVQLQSEIDSRALVRRVKALEDPISSLHIDVPELSRRFYHAIQAKNEARLEFDDDFYDRFGRCLAALDSEGYIEVLPSHRRYPVAVRLKDPSYIMYLAALSAPNARMAKLIEIVDNCPAGQWLNGEEVEKEIGLPLPIVRACFTIFEAQGYGLCSQALGAVRYLGRV